MSTPAGDAPFGIKDRRHLRRGARRSPGHRTHCFASRIPGRSLRLCASPRLRPRHRSAAGSQAIRIQGCFEEIAAVLQGKQWGDVYLGTMQSHGYLLQLSSGVLLDIQFRDQGVRFA